MKKIVVFIVSICFVVSLAACGATTSEVNKINPSSAEQKINSSSVEDTTASIGETLDFNGLQITFDSIEKFEDKSGMNKLEDGKMFVMLWFTANNTTGEDQYINMFYEDSYCDDTAVDPVSVLFGASGDSLWGDVAAGKKRKGYVAYKVDSSWSSIEFSYEPELFDKAKMTFKATPDDLSD